MKRKRPIGYNRERYHNGRLKKNIHSSKCFASVHKHRAKGYRWRGTLLQMHVSFLYWRPDRTSGLPVMIFERPRNDWKGDRHGQRDQASPHREPATR